MKRGELAPEELDRVIKLKKLGTSWLKIEHETGINRRTAKRAYEKWEHSQSPEVLREARREVIAKAFLDHLRSLTILAGAVVANLNVPVFLTDVEKNSEQFFAWLWEQDLLNRLALIEVETEEARLVIPRPSVLDPQSYHREKELLFKCLQDHTRGEGVRWEALEEWKKARDNCAKIVPKLQKETSEVVKNFVKQEQETNFLQRVKEDSREKDPAKQIAEVVLRAIWQAICQDKLDEEGPLFEMVSRIDGSSHTVYTKHKDEIVLGFTDKDLADKVTGICNSAVNNLR
ncbi:hypothetical protein ES703_72746 [subsurface metagenome]